MSQKIIIELGTNTMKVLHARRTQDDWEILNELVLPTRLGEGLQRTHLLSPQAQERNLKAVSDLVFRFSSIKDLSFDIIATAALRHAKNTEQFIQAVKDTTGLTITLLSGKEEAKLSFLACARQISDKNLRLGVLDIGGGSTEFTIGHTGKIDLQISTRYGAVSLTERFFEHDPPYGNEILACQNYVAERVMKYKESISIDKLTGVGGTLTTLVYLEEKQAFPFQTYTLKIDKILHWAETLARMPLEKKQMLPGMMMGRADIILAGVMILLQFIRISRSSDILVSSQGIRHGWLYAHC
ncbi:MAG TPA: hypothetical protein PLF50_02930 [Candidatus Cloacimonadota bacterium]|nr:hypothetical protein [Candidatus Cloacimonadota bacterium]